jgi:hypothetical protein
MANPGPEDKTEIHPFDLTAITAVFFCHYDLGAKVKIL